MLVTSEQVSVWAKRIGAQRAQVAVTNSLSEMEFDRIHARRSKQMESNCVQL